MKIALKTCTLALSLATANLAHAAYFGSSWGNTTINYKLSYNTGNPAVDLSPAQKATFEAAVNYFNTNTKIRFVDATGNNAVTDYVPVSRIDGGISYGTGYCFAFCQPSLQLSDNANQKVAVHELMHVLGFFHEHQRQTRDNYVEVDPTTPADRMADYDIINYPFYLEQDLGRYDYNSIMHYSERLMLKLDNSTTISKLKDTSSPKAVRIGLTDSTASNSYDNLYLNNENTIGSDNPAIKVSPYQFGWQSAQFIVEPNQDGTFNLKHVWSLKYLSETAGAFSFKSSADSSSKWKIIDNGNGFKIQNNSSSKYIFANAGTVSLTTANSSAWLIKMETVRNPNDATLSMMDKVALHKFYGFPFRIVQADGTPDPTDNFAINTERGFVEVGSAPQNWFSAKWYLERSNDTYTPYVRIKNRYTGEYLHNEFGTIDDAPASTTNGSGVTLPNWWSAQWVFEIQNGFFYIKNRASGLYIYNNNGVLNSGSTPDATYRWQLNEMPVNF